MRRRFTLQLSSGPLLDIGDLAVLLLIAAVLYLGVRIAVHAPAIIQGPTISLDPRALPWYALLSTGRMLAAYLLSLTFSVIYGYTAARSRTAERLLMPLLDVLQSVPILSFLPVVLLSLSALLPQAIAVELASIVLIFTSQVWNLTFYWYQSLITIPEGLCDVATSFRFSPWLRFRMLELPIATAGLIWNSITSWGEGWFFLMASEAFTIGQRDFRLPGLGAYLHTAANAGDSAAILWGIGTLLVVVVLLDQFIWRPLLAWSERFRLDMIERDEPSTSWFYYLLQHSRALQRLSEHMLAPLLHKMALTFFRRKRRQGRTPVSNKGKNPSRGRILYPVVVLLGIGLVYGAWQAARLLLTLPLTAWGEVALATSATFVRVFAALVIVLCWTVPIGVLIGTRPRAAAVLQPMAQILFSVPATALFPTFLLLFLRLPFGLNLAAMLVILLGMQDYLFYNVIAGARAIPRELEFTARLLQLRGWTRWRTMILPALFPYLVTGMISAVGAAWNASVVAEYAQFGGHTYAIRGVGSLIAQATARGDYALLLAATLTMILTVVLTNRLFWHRLYRIAEERYKMEME